MASTTKMFPDEEDIILCISDDDSKDTESPAKVTKRQSIKKRRSTIAVASLFSKKPKIEPGIQQSEKRKSTKTKNAAPKTEVIIGEKSQPKTKVANAPIKTDETATGLDFLKKFRKSITKMTKSDLEDLIMVKIAESLSFESNFNELKSKIERQQTIIRQLNEKMLFTNNYVKDLMLIHKNLEKDLKEHNKKLVMPVKIGRCIALQVNLPPLNSAQTLNSNYINPIVNMLPVNASVQLLPRGETGPNMHPVTAKDAATSPPSTSNSKTSLINFDLANTRKTQKVLPIPQRRMTISAGAEQLMKPAPLSRLNNGKIARIIST